jgi:hypothetical protein
VLRLNGYTHLTPLEGYSYYGYPLLGMILMAVALLRMRDLLPERSAPDPVMENE